MLCQNRAYFQGLFSSAWEADHMKHDDPSNHWAVHNCGFGIISLISSEKAVTFINNTCALCSIVKMRGQLSTSDKEKEICSLMRCKYKASVTTCLLSPKADSYGIVSQKQLHRFPWIFTTIGKEKAEKEH